LYHIFTHLSRITRAFYFASLPKAPRFLNELLKCEENMIFAVKPLTLGEVSRLKAVPERALRCKMIPSQSAHADSSPKGRA
jgi:hypothetical protein